MKAQAVFVVLIVLMVASATSLIWGIIISERLHVISQASEAVKAFYAADSALDCKFYKTYIDQTESCPPSLTNGTKANLEKLPSPSNETLIKATGWTIKTQVYRALTAKF
ncbi:hypothetical protein J7K91_01030 [bacterium]|nr:hypothetical protein [bacterium]